MVAPILAERQPLLRDNAARPWRRLLAAAATCAALFAFRGSTRPGATALAAASPSAAASKPTMYVVESDLGQGGAAAKCFTCGYHASFLADVVGVELDKQVTVPSLSALLDGGRLRAGDVVVFSLISEMVTGAPGTSAPVAAVDAAARNAPGSTNDQAYLSACSYHFGEENRLLYAPAVARLLAVERPLTLVLADDWSCHAQFPANSKHNVLRNGRGAGVMDGVTYLPFGVQYVPATDFYHARDAAPLLPASERPVVFSGAGAGDWRKPSRDVLNATVARHRGDFDARFGGDTWVVDYYKFQISRDGFSGPGYTWTESATALDNGIGDYFDLLRRSRLTLCPAGDVWEGGCVVQALEMGSVPVVEDAARYKGCEDPAAFYRDSGAFLVRDWSALPSLLAEWADAGLLDGGALDARQAGLAAWWADAKRKLKQNVAAFAAAAPASTNACAAAPLAGDARAAALETYAAYYAQDHWWDDFEDSPWLPGQICSKLYQTVTKQAACFSSACAPPVFASIECG